MAISTARAGDWDFTAKEGAWWIKGWTDGYQVTCGIANKANITDQYYFSLYTTHVNKTTSEGDLVSDIYWDVETSTRFKVGAKVFVSFIVDDQFTIDFPIELSVSRTANENRPVVGTKNDACTFEADCVNAIANSVTKMFLSKIKDSSVISLNLTRSNNHELRRVRLINFDTIRKDLEECIMAISSKMKR